MGGWMDGQPTDIRVDGQINVGVTTKNFPGNNDYLVCNMKYNHFIKSYMAEGDNGSI